MIFLCLIVMGLALIITYHATPWGQENEEKKEKALPDEVEPAVRL